MNEIRSGKLSSAVHIPSAKAETFDADSYLDAAAGGDEGALTALINEFSGMVFQVALRTVGSVHDAEDVLQDVFLGLTKALANYESGNFPAWLKRYTHNRALMLVRSDRRRDDRARVAALDASAVEGFALERVMIEKALAEIDDSLSEVFVLRWMGYKHAEIGARLGISETASQLRYHRAKVALRRILEN